MSPPTSAPSASRQRTDDQMAVAIIAEDIPLPQTSASPKKTRPSDSGTMST